MSRGSSREADMQHRIAELEEQLKAAKAATLARAGLREYLAKHPALTRADVLIIAEEMRAPGRFAKSGKPSALGKTLRDARLAKSLSASDAADKIGVSIASISHWERGAGRPGGDYHSAIKRVLGVDVAALVKSTANGSGASH